MNFIATIEGERPEERNSPFHKRIVKTFPIPNTRAGETEPRAWMVSRHYIALHGLKAEELPELARRYHFPEVPVIEPHQPS